jgi:hypothetical protein
MKNIILRLLVTEHPIKTWKNLPNCNIPHIFAGVLTISINE